MIYSPMKRIGEGENLIFIYTAKCHATRKCKTSFQKPNVLDVNYSLGGIPIKRQNLLFELMSVWHCIFSRFGLSRRRCSYLVWRTWWMSSHNGEKFLYSVQRKGIHKYHIKPTIIYSESEHSVLLWSKKCIDTLFHERWVYDFQISHTVDF